MLKKRSLIMTELAERLIFLMENMDMKQTELADKVGISKQSLYKYLHCKCEPRAEIIARMAKSLNTTADFIVGLTNNPRPFKNDKTSEQHAYKELEFINKFRRLSAEDKIRIEERINIFLEESDNKNNDKTNVEPK